jgi:hypothetical protein
MQPRIQRKALFLHQWPQLFLLELSWTLKSRSWFLPLPKSLIRVYISLIERKFKILK